METIKVGIVGAGWMGRAHARAYQRLQHHWPDFPLRAEVAAVADLSADAARELADAHSIPKVSSDWRDLVADGSIDAVSVTCSNVAHREIGVAVAEAGKHLWIEKPVGLGPADAIAVRDAVAGSGVVGCVGFNYRNVPAVARARRLIDEGAIGTPTHARVSLFTDYAADPGSPLSWRFTLADGGHGVLGDLASHGVDFLRFLLGDITSLVARTAIHVPERPIVAARDHYSTVDLSQEGLVFGAVENEDYVVAMVEMTSGVLAVCEASRVAVGEQNSYQVEVHGTQGFVRWDFRRPSELHLSSGDDYGSQATTVVFAEPGDGEYSRFQPGPGITMSYDDTKVIEAMNFVRAIAGEPAPVATLDDAVASAVALDAMVTSERDRRWVAL